MADQPSDPKSLWDAFGRLLFVLALAAGLAWIVRDSIMPTFDRNQRLAAEIQKARRLLEDLQTEREALVNQIRSLESDPFYVEYLLRNKFGFRRPGEVVLSRGR